MSWSLVGAFDSSYSSHSYVCTVTIRWGGGWTRAAGRQQLLSMYRRSVFVMMMMMNSLARRWHDGDGLLLLSVVGSSHPYFASFIRLRFGMNVTFTFLAKKQIKMTKGYYGVVGLWSFQTCLVVGTICSAEQYSRRRRRMAGRKGY